MGRIRTKLVIGVFAVLGIVGINAPLAGATPVNPGSNMACSPNADHCSGTQNSAHIPCMKYNVTFDHVWIDPNNPGAELAHGGAWWIVTIDRWWICQAGGNVFIETAAVIPIVDTIAPTVRYLGTEAQVVFSAEYWAGFFNQMSNVIEWSRCSFPNNAQTPDDGRSFGVYVSAASAPANTYLGGRQTFTATCLSNGAPVFGQYGQLSDTRQVTPVSVWSYDGAYIKWNHTNQYESWSGNHPYVYITLW